LKKTINILSLLLISLLCSAQDSLSYAPTQLHLAKETNLDINHGTQINLNANLNLHSDVKGKGILKIHSTQTTYINAYGQSVPNLSIKTKKRVILLSELKIKEEIKITEGELVLQDHNLFINENTKIDKYTLKNINEEQEGKMILVKQYKHNALFSSILLKKIKAKAAKQVFPEQSLLILNNNNRGSPLSKVYYSDPYAKVESPPPKKTVRNKFNNNKNSIL